jgi:uncharacterized phage infection (PIP) family protein YhgE
MNFLSTYNTGFGYLVSGRLYNDIQTILGGFKKMTDSLSQLDSALSQLASADAQLTSVVQIQASAISQLQSDFNALVAKIQASGVAIDYTSEVASAQAALQAVNDAVTALTQANAAAQTLDQQVVAENPTPPAVN